MSSLLTDIYFSNLDYLLPWNLKTSAEESLKTVNFFGMKCGLSEILADCNCLIKLYRFSCSPKCSVWSSWETIPFQFLVVIQKWYRFGLE